MYFLLGLECLELCNSETLQILRSKRTLPAPWRNRRLNSFRAYFPVEKNWTSRGLYGGAARSLYTARIVELFNIVLIIGGGFVLSPRKKRKPTLPWSRETSEKDDAIRATASIRGRLNTHTAQPPFLKPSPPPLSWNHYPLTRFFVSVTVYLCNLPTRIGNGVQRIDYFLKRDRKHRVSNY